MGWPWDKEKLQITQCIVWCSHTPVKNTWESRNKLIFINTDGCIIIRPGFIWNGCSNVPSGKCVGKDILKTLPVISLTENCVGITWKASLIHDIICKYCTEPNFPFTRKQGDQFFFTLLQECGFKRPRLYYYGVSAFSVVMYVKNAVMHLL